MDLKAQLENLQRQKLGYKAKKGQAKIVKKTYKPSLSPDKPTPVARPRRLQALLRSSTDEQQRSVEKDSATKGSTSASNAVTVEEEEGEENNNDDVEADLYQVKRTDYGQIEDFSASTLGQRRLRLAGKVALDAKFLNFTQRLTTNSVLQLPLRLPHAPHLGKYIPFFYS